MSHLVLPEVFLLRPSRGYVSSDTLGLLKCKGFSKFWYVTEEG